MSDMNTAIIPKSDQLNYDDFIGKESILIKISEVRVKSGEQPVSIYYEGDNGKPWKPCKSMCRVLVYCWGNDSKQYVGRKIKLYGDPKVKWAGMEVGGIRISALSDISEKQTIQLTSSKGKRNIFVVEKLEQEKEEKFDLEALKEVLRNCKDIESLTENYKIAVKLCGNNSNAKDDLKSCAGECKKFFEVK